MEWTHCRETCSSIGAIQRSRLGFKSPSSIVTIQYIKKNGVDAIELNLSYLSKKEYENKKCPSTLAKVWGNLGFIEPKKRRMGLPFFFVANMIEKLQWNFLRNG